MLCPKLWASFTRSAPNLKTCRDLFICERIEAKEADTENCKMSNNDGAEVPFRMGGDRQKNVECNKVLALTPGSNS